jgi:predicted ATPase
MLRSLEIQSFHSLKNLYLRELTDVNILTGENGSGKSLVLKYLLNHYENCALLRDGLSYTEYDEQSVILDKISTIDLVSEDYWELVEFLPELEGYYKSRSGVERGGLDKLIKICKAVYKLHKYKGIKLFLIDEPETHLHPKLQKDVVKLLGKLAAHLKIQFFVETHSPFVISESAILVDFQEKQSRNYRSRFYPGQKVYFMKNGKISDKNGVSGIKGEYGYWGSKVNTIAGKMLGAGLMDLVSKADFDLSINSPYLVFCEGQGRDEDEKFYNIVFQNRLPRVLFVSSRGSSQLESTFQLLRQIRSGLAANFKLLMLRDRDHEFVDHQAILEYQKSRTGVKVLHRRAIECYIYNSETARLLYQKYNQVCDPHFLKKLDKLNQQIQKEAETGVKGDDYKTRLKNSFYEAIANLDLDSQGYDDLIEQIATLINPDTEVYKELGQLIFG